MLSAVGSGMMFSRKKFCACCCIAGSGGRGARAFLNTALEGADNQVVKRGGQMNFRYRGVAKIDLEAITMMMELKSES
jgi:hypothetical protein